MNGVTTCQVLVSERAVDDFLEQHNLLYGAHGIQTALLQLDGPRTDPNRPNPCVMLVAEVDGKKRVIKTTLRMLMTISDALNGAACREHGEGWRG